MCDECDPSFTCYNGSTECRKKPQLPAVEQAVEFAKSLVDCADCFSDRCSIVLVNELLHLRVEVARLEQCRLMALKNVGFHVSSIPESHLENNRLEHAFILAAHRVLATGDANALLQIAANQADTPNDLAVAISRNTMDLLSRLPKPENMHGAGDGFGGSDYPDVL